MSQSEMQTLDAWRWLGTLSCGCLALAWGRRKDAAEGEDKAALSPVHINYLVLHFLVRLADWLQGTNMYTLYVSYGVDPGTLFLTGFISSAVFSTFVGHLIDQYGRKKGCIAYCVIEIVIQILEHIPDMTTLMVGRVLGGLSTSILFSSFESWIVGAHKRRGHRNAALERMFSITSTLNGVSAVLAGLIARVAFIYLGEIGPFQVSLGITVVCLVVIAVSWEENKAEQKTDEKTTSWSLDSLKNHPGVVVFGLTQAAFEGCMFTFVFVWVQALLSVCEAEHGGRPPTELIFSCLMLALAIGGLLFEIGWARLPKYHRKWVGTGVFAVSAVSMSAISFVLQYPGAFDHLIAPHSLVLFAFCLFEVCVGVFDPWIAIMRSVFVPESILATMMTLSRVPLNVFVGLGVYITDHMSLPAVFASLGVAQIAAALCFTAAVSRLQWRQVKKTQ